MLIRAGRRRFHKPGRIIQRLFISPPRQGCPTCPCHQKDISTSRIKRPAEALLPSTDLVMPHHSLPAGSLDFGGERIGDTATLDETGINQFADSIAPEPGDDTSVTPVTRTIRGRGLCRKCRQRESRLIAQGQGPQLWNRGWRAGCRIMDFHCGSPFMSEPSIWIGRGQRRRCKIDEIRIPLMASISGDDGE